MPIKSHFNRRPFHSFYFPSRAKIDTYTSTARATIRGVSKSVLISDSSSIQFFLSSFLNNNNLTLSVVMVTFPRFMSFTWVEASEMERKRAEKVFQTQQQFQSGLCCASLCKLMRFIFSHSALHYFMLRAHRRSGLVLFYLFSVFSLRALFAESHSAMLGRSRIIVFVCGRS